MNEVQKLCEHESVEWILRKIPKFTNVSILKKLQNKITCMDVSLDLFVFGTIHGVVFILNRKNDSLEYFIIKKTITICSLKLIRTVDLSVAIGFVDGSLYILNMPFNEQLNYAEMVQYVVPTDHKSSITAVSWSKNSEKLFTGDTSGLICCAEINYLNKTVSTYEVCNTQSRVNQLCYDHRYLLVSNNNESFIWNFASNKRILIGAKPRQENGKFGISFIKKLCKSEEMEIIVTRSNGKIWISDSQGTIKRSIVLKSDLIFTPEKSVCLLPCLTSQSTNPLVDDIKSKKTKYHLGLSIPITEQLILFWSEEALVIVNIATGQIAASSCNIGKIQCVSVCVLDKFLKTNLISESGVQAEDYPTQYEVWILRQSLQESDSKLVRLSFIPLITTKLVIDPFYYISQAKIANNNDRILDDTLSDHSECSKHSDRLRYKPKDLVINSDVNVVESGSIKDNVSESINSLKTDSHLDNWLHKISVKKQNIDETLNDMRSNVFEITKEVMKQGQSIFETSTEEEGLEQALELTEDGLKMNFGTSETPLDNVEIQVEHRTDLTVKDSHLINIPVPVIRRDIRKVLMITVDEDGEIPDKSESIVELDLPMKPIVDIDKNVSLASTSYGSEINKSGSYENSDSFIMENTHQSVSPLIVDQFSVEKSGNFDKYFYEDESSIIIEESQSSANVPIDVFQVSRDLESDLSTSVPSIDLSIEHLEDKPVDTSELMKQDDALASIRTLEDDVIEKSNDDVKENRNSIELNDFQISQTILDGNNIPRPTSVIKVVEVDHIEIPLPSEERVAENIDESLSKVRKVPLTNDLLLKCNKWISHRGPNLSYGTKLSSMIVNRRMIWLNDTKGNLHIGFYREESEKYSSDIAPMLSDNDKLVWLLDTELRSDKILSSPGGFILWSDRAGEISAYMGITKIWSPKVVKEKVLLKTYWEATMRGIKDFDIDDDMAVIVTKTGQLKVMNGISSRNPYTKSLTVNITGHVTLATTFGGIVWCVTEMDMRNTNSLSQHVFACLSRDEIGEINISYWRTVPLAPDLVRPNEKDFGVLGGSELIRSIQLGIEHLAWILTIDNMCMFSRNVTADNPAGDGVWYQISLQFLIQSPSVPEEHLYYFHNRVQTMLGYSEERRSSFITSKHQVVLSSKCASKRAKGNGLLWISPVDRNSPCILFESNKNIIGHHWADCFDNDGRSKTKVMGLPAVRSWSSVEISMNDTLWLLHKTGELFCYWNENKIRSIAIPPSFGRIQKIAAFNSTVAVLTTKLKILLRTGIMENNPIGSDWKEIKSGWSQKDAIKNITCSDNQIWIICENYVYLINDVNLHLFDSSRKFSWDLIHFKISDGNAKRLSNIQSAKIENKHHTWGISDPDGYVYMTIWKSIKDNFNWVYIPGPRAESIHLSHENLWMVEQHTGNIFVRCGLNWHNQPAGDYWIHVPLVTGPVMDLAVSLGNRVFVIDALERLLVHCWTIIEGNGDSDCDLPSMQSMTSMKTEDHDWELLT